MPDDIVFALLASRANKSPAGLTPRGLGKEAVQSDVCMVKNTLRDGWVQ